MGQRNKREGLTQQRKKGGEGSKRIDSQMVERNNEGQSESKR